METSKQPAVMTAGSHETLQKTRSQDEQSKMPFFRQIYAGAWITQGIAVAADLGIADLLTDGPRSPEELAEQTQTDGKSLHRLLRALASVGVFAGDAGGRFRLTPLAELLRSNVRGSQRPYAVMMGAEFYKAWGQLLYSARTGRPGFNRVFGSPFFEYMMNHPDRHVLYDAAMNVVHGGETQPILDAYDFGAFRTVVDIGGGNGLLLNALLKRYPSLQGVLFDLPAVSERALPAISASDISGRCRVQGGDFFSSVPPGADAYVLRHIILDWEDPDAISILRRCEEAMNHGGRMLVVETVIQPGNEPGFAKCLDLMMLLVAGCERTLEEYDRLFSAAGLKLNRVIATSTEVSIVEGVRLA